MQGDISAEALFIFDVDGVITDPHTKTPNPFIIHFIAQQLTAHKPVAIGTGRSAGWLEEHLVPLIKQAVSNHEDIDNLFLAGEKGSVTIIFSEGKPTVYVDKGVFVPEEIRKKIQKKVSEYPTIFDNGKQTMVSIEIEGGNNKEKVAQEKKALDELEIWIEKEIHPTKEHLILERSVIALDIQQEQVNKRLVAEKFLTFLEKKQYSSISFIVFGDSPSDIHIAEALYDKKYEVVFGYVGFREIEEHKNFLIIRSAELFDNGVVSILKNIYNK